MNNSTETNFVEKALDNGFVSKTGVINPNNNWFGASVYHPDIALERGSKMIILSLQGNLMPDVKNPTEEFFKVANTGNLKYISFKNGNEKVYETYYGQLPSDEFIEQFINTV